MGFGIDRFSNNTSLYLLWLSFSLGCRPRQTTPSKTHFNHWFMWGIKDALKSVWFLSFFPFPFFVQNWKSTFYCANTHFICILERSVWWAFSAGHYSFCRRQKPSRDFEKSEHVNSYLLPNWFVFDGIRSHIVLKMVSPRVSSKNVDRELWVSAHFHKRLIYCFYTGRVLKGTTSIWFHTFAIHRVCTHGKRNLNSTAFKLSDKKNALAHQFKALY